MKCPVCSAELPPTAKFCGGCGTTLTAPPQPTPFFPEASYEQARPMMNPPPPSYGGNTPPTVQKKYKILRFIAVLIKVFAFIAGAIFIIGALVMLAAGVASSSQTSGFDTGPTALLGGVVGGLLMLVNGVFVFVFLYAISELMYVFMDIEENTRVTFEMLSGRK